MTITMGGIISSFRRTTTKRTGAFMAFITVEDTRGSLECVCFPNLYEKVSSVLAVDKIVKLRGKLDFDSDGSITCIVDDLQAVEVSTPDLGKQQSAEATASAVLWLNASALNDAEFSELVNTLSNYEGGTVCKIVDTFCLRVSIIAEGLLPNSLYSSGITILNIFKN